MADPNSFFQTGINQTLPSMMGGLGKGQDFVSGLQDQGDRSLNDYLLKNAQKNLSDYNKNGKKIQSQDMGVNCAKCSHGWQKKTIDKLEHTKNLLGGEDEGSLSYKGTLDGGKFIKGSADVTGKYKFDDMTGDYYYKNPKNQHWIHVTAKDAVQGKGVESEIGVGLKGDAEVVGGSASLDTGRGGSIPSSQHIGLPSSTNPDP